MRSTLFALLLPLVAVLGGETECVLFHCASELAQCEIDTICRTWSNCNTKCISAKGGLPCQIRCADLYKPTNSSAGKINSFSACVISENHCVPRVNETCTVPHTDVTKFDLNQLTGHWFITRGWNPMFDCFDCQKHHFTVNTSTAAAKPLMGDLKYEVKQDLNCTFPDCTYLDREVFQNFAQSDKANPAHLTNYNNSLAELHYADDWYVLAAKDDTYALIYYCGCNDATCGYSGAVLYTRVSSWKELDATSQAEVGAALDKAGVKGLSMNAMCTTDNRSCE